MKLFLVQHPDVTDDGDDRSPNDNRPMWRIVSAEDAEHAAIEAGMPGGEVDELAASDRREVIASLEPQAGEEIEDDDESDDE